MKNFKILNCLTVLFLLLSFSSCKKMLDENYKSGLSPDNYFTDDASLKGGIIGAYAQLKTVYGGKGKYIATVGTDIESTQYTVGDILGLDTYLHTSIDPGFLAYWTDNYALIQRTNVLIQRIPSIAAATEPVKKRIMAEAKFLRALTYFNMVRVFGGVPLVLDETTSFDFGMPRASIKDVYTQILSDLNGSLEEGSLPKPKDLSEPGRVNYWAAKSLKGRVLLTIASYKESGKVAGYADLEGTPQSFYEQARDVLNEVMTSGLYKLEPVYGDVFTIEKKNINSESIWEVQFGNDPYGSGWSKDYGLYWSGASPSSVWQVSGMLGQNVVKPTVSFFFNYYKTGDIRKDWNIPAYTINFTNQIITDKKVIDINKANTQTSPATDKNTWRLMGTAKYRWGAWNDQHSPYFYTQLPNNFIVLRYADVLLMYAEAAMKANGGKATQAGVDAVNLVIQRARGLDVNGVKIPASATPSFPDYTTTTLTFAQLFIERARELCFEKIRWFDLARTGQLKAIIEARYATTSVAKVDESKHYLYPIPSTELDKTTNSTGFYQNPGY